MEEIYSSRDGCAMRDLEVKALLSSNEVVRTRADALYVPPRPVR